MDARVSVMPWAATRVAPMISAGPAGSWKAWMAASRAGSESLAQEMQRVGEAVQHRLLDLDVTGEHDQRLAGGEEVIDPGQRRRELAASGQALEGPQLSEALGAQRGGDPGVELGEVERLGAQPGDHVALGEAVLGLVGERHRHDDLALGRQLGEHVGLEPADEAAAAQMPVQPLLAELAPELLGEPGAGAEVLQAPDDAQLGDQLVGVVEHRGPGEREAQAVRATGPRAGGPPGCAWRGGFLQ